MPSASMDDDPPHGYRDFYRNVILFPQLGVFRRYGAYWAKKLHDETSEVHVRLKALNQEIQDRSILQANDVLKCPRAIVEERYPVGNVAYDSLYQAWDAFDAALMKYGETLCMSTRIMNLPAQDAFNIRDLARYNSSVSEQIFVDGKFVLTGEKASWYQGDPNEQDVCGWKTAGQKDFLTRCLIHLGRWIEDEILVKWRNRRSRYRTQPQPTARLRASYLVEALDTLSCLFASACLAVAIKVLTVVKSTTLRIAIIAIFGTLFVLLLKLMAGSPSRGEVFGAAAAFYAVAAVFVGSANEQCCHG